MFIDEEEEEEPTETQKEKEEEKEEEKQRQTVEEQEEQKRGDPQREERDISQTWGTPSRPGPRSGPGLNALREGRPNCFTSCTLLRRPRLCWVDTLPPLPCTSS